jgi:hypothetical protein
MRKLLIVAVVLIFAVMSLGYTPAPAPVVPPGQPPLFDPNLAASPVMGCFVVYVGTTKNGQLDIVEPEGESVTIETSRITIGTFTTVLDPADPGGLAKKYTYNWTYKPAAIDVGTHYVNVITKDVQGNQSARTIVLIVKQNAAPVPTGCR